MKKSIQWMLFLALALILVLPACVRPATTPAAPKATVTPEINFETATPVTSAMATATALARPDIVTATPQPPAGNDQQQGGGGGGDSQSGGGQTQPTQPPANNNNVQPTRPIPATTRPDSYTLQSGEWPICIARRFDVNLSDLLSANGMTMNSRPGAGTTLKIPSGGSWNSSAHGARAWHTGSTYKVAGGDNLYSIACYFGDKSPEAILAANGLNSAADVKTGMTLNIP